MRFRPCIDIHNGKVKQIVGGSLRDKGDSARTNFSSELGADHYARLYQKDGLKGGHIIMLNHAGSEYYEATRRQALSALAAYPGGMQIGGGITAENAAGYLEAGASHVIVTSYVFKDGAFCRENMEKLVSEVGKEHIVLDLSCRKREGAYYIVTDRWQKFTEEVLSADTLEELAGSWGEFLVRGVEVEGTSESLEKAAARLGAEHYQEVRNNVGLPVLDFYTETEVREVSPEGDAMILGASDYFLPHEEDKMRWIIGNTKELEGSQEGWLRNNCTIEARLVDGEWTAVDYSTGILHLS